MCCIILVGVVSEAHTVKEPWWRAAYPEMTSDAKGPEKSLYQIGVKQKMRRRCVLESHDKYEKEIYQT